VEHTTVNGRYRIDSRLGDGGMAEVFLGHDLLLNRPVAVKVLRQQFAQDVNVRIRFEREAQAAANFSHAHIVEVYDVGEQDQIPYIVMEYVQGETLKQVIDDEGPFDADDVSALLEQIGSALDYAHARGVVHRDVKPQNILVDADGLAKVTDFGIAKAVTDSNLTETGTGIGTVHYLSPEQANGLMATPSSDVYSLGVVAFEMLTQALPFDAESPVAVAVAHTRDEPPRPSTLEPTITGAVDAIVLRALEKDPTRRYRTAGEFAAAMSDWKHYRAPTRPRARPGDGTGTVGPRGPVHPLDPDATVAIPAQSNHAAYAPSTAPPRPVGPPPVAPAPVMAGGPASAARRDDTRNDLGCGSWVTGIIVSVLLVGLIVIGAWFSDGIPDNLPTFGFGQERSDDDVVAPGASAGASAPAPGAGPNDGPTETPVTTITAPDVVGMDVESARATLEEQGLALQVSSERRFSSTIQVESVAQQDPPSGAEVDSGGIVTVILSSGPAEVDIDALNVVGIPADDARVTLEEQGLRVVRAEVGSTTVPEGSVAEIEPQDSVPAGSEVTIFVSQGDRILLPVTTFGQPVDQATSDLTAAGFIISGTASATRAAIEAAGVDLAAAGIEDGDVVGVQNSDQTASFGVWLPPGTELTLVVYDASRDAEARNDAEGAARQHHNPIVRRT
jgi:serine/threonine-protein kinase